MKHYRVFFVFLLTFLMAAPVFGASVEISAPTEGETVSGSANFVCSAAADPGKYVRSIFVTVDGSRLAEMYCSANATTCSYDYEKVTGHLWSLPHGSHNVYCTSTESISTLTWVNSRTVTFDIDRTPSYTLTNPLGTANSYFKVSGTAHFVGWESPPTNYGSIIASVGNTTYGSYTCKTQDCLFDFSSSTTALGEQNLKIEVRPYLGNSVFETRTINIDRIAPDSIVPEIPNAPSTDVCWNSATNVTNGNVSHHQTLFEADARSPLPTKLEFFYDSRDELCVPFARSNFKYKLPLGQGWTHSYDISLFINPDGSAVFKGGGAAKWYFALSGTSFVPSQGDYSTLVKNPNYTYTLTERNGTKYLFTSTGILTSITDRFGNAVTVVNNGASANKTVTVTDPAGRTIRFLYDANNTQVLSIIDPDQQTYDLTYDAIPGLLTKVTFPAPSPGAPRPVWQFGYNSYRLMTSKTDPMGNIITYDYNPTTHRVTNSVSPSGAKAMSSGAGSAVLTEEDGGAWNYTYDTTSRLLTGQSGPLGSSANYTYNAVGLFDTEERPVDSGTSYVRQYQYDSYGNVTNIKGHARHSGPPVTDDPVDLDVSYTYDNGNFDQITSIRNNLDSPPTTTTFAYSVAGGFNQILMTAPDGTQTTTRLNQKGTIHDITDAAGQVTSFDYDANNRLISVSYPSGLKKQFSNFTGKGYPQTVTIFDSTGVVKQTIQITYDSFGKVLTQSVPGSGTTYTSSWGYDLNGNVSQITDANGNVTQIVSNFKGQPTLVTDTLQATTQMDFKTCAACGVGSMMSQLKDANGNATAFEYDQEGRLSKETDPLGKTIRYTYTAAGKVWQKINDVTGEAIITYSYDPQGRLTGRTYLDGSWDSFGYTPGGRLATAANQNISYTFAYDNAGRLQSITASNGKVVSYTYNAAGQRRTVTALSGTLDQHTVTYGYTAGRLSSLTSSQAGTFGFGHDTLGRRSSLSYPNGVSATYNYHQDQPAWLLGISYSGTQPIYSVNYPSFDKVGNRTSKTENTATVAYAYDLVYRLLNVTGAATESFTYDATGNRLTDAAKIYSIGGANTLLAVGGTNYGHDDFGNTVTAGAWTYGWNSAGQMVSASNGSTTASYAYDPFGRRVSKTVDGVATTYVYDGANIAASITSGAVTHFVQGPGTDEHLAMVRGGASYFYHVDGLGSTATITDAGQNIVQSYSYAAFGAPAASTAFDQPYQFTGREFDAETGLNYHRARYLDLGTGRWLSRDPLGFAAGDVALTNYVGGNPGNFTDPSGLVNAGMLSKAFREISGGTILLAGGVGLTTYTGGSGALIGVPAVLTGAGMITRGTVRGITGLGQNQEVPIPNPSIVHNAAYIYSQNHEIADLVYNSYSLILGSSMLGLTSSMSSLESLYNILDTGDTLNSIGDNVRNLTKCGKRSK